MNCLKSVHMVQAVGHPVWIVLGIVMIYLVGFGMIIPLLPLIAKHYGASGFQVGLLMSIFSLMQFIFSFVWGRLSDFWGRKGVLILCLILEGVSYVVLALANHLSILFVARALTGIFGGSISTANAILSDLSSKSERTRTLALMGAAFGLGFLIGPAIGGAINYLAALTWPNQSIVGLRLSSALVALFCWIAAFLAWKWLKETHHLKTHTESKPSLKQLFNLSFLDRVSLTLLGNMFFHTAAMALMEATLVLRVNDLLGWGSYQIAWAFTYLGLVSVIMQGFVVRRLVKYISEIWILPVGLLAQMIGFGGLVVAQTSPGFALTLTILVMGNALSFSSIMGLLSQLHSNDVQGGILGLSQAMGSLGRLLGPAVGGYLYTHYDPTSPFRVSVVVIGFSTLAYLLWAFGKLKKNIEPVTPQPLESQWPVEQTLHWDQLLRLLNQRIPFILVCDHPLSWHKMLPPSLVTQWQARQLEWDFHKDPGALSQMIKQKDPHHQLPVVVARLNGPPPFTWLARFQGLVATTHLYVLNESAAQVLLNPVAGGSSHVHENLKSQNPTDSH